MGVVLFAFLFVGLVMRFPALIWITLWFIVLFYVCIYAIAFVWWILGGAWEYLVVKPYTWLDKKYFQKNKALRWFFSIKWFYILIGVLFVGFLIRGFFIDNPNSSNSSNSNINNYVISTDYGVVNTWNESDLNSDYITGYIDEIIKEENKASPYKWCSYVWVDWAWHKCWWFSKWFWL